MSKAAVTRDGSTDSFNAERTVDTAEWVRGEVIAKSDSLVTCDLRAVEDAERRGKASFSVSSAETGASCAGAERVVWNRSRRAMVVGRTMESCLDILAVQSMYSSEAILSARCGKYDVMDAEKKKR